MRVVRETAIAMTKPREILSVPRIPFLIITAICFLIVDRINIHLGIFAWVAACALIRGVVKKHPRILQIFWVARKFKSVYDPFKREPFSMVIVEDEYPRRRISA